MTDETTIPRRTFLAQVAALGAAGGAGLVPAVLQPTARAASGSAPVGELNLATFKLLVGGKFRLHPPKAAPVDVELMQVMAARPPAGKGTAELRQEPFALLFRGRPGLKQQTYRIEHDQLGVLDLFIVPVDRPAKGRYEVVVG
jgi:hypothetical protein